MNRSGDLPHRLLDWLAEHGLAANGVDPLEGDVSLRRYYRIRFAGNPKTAIAAFYPPELRSSYRSGLLSARLLSDAEVRVARILIDDPLEELALLEDFGDRSLFSLPTGGQSVVRLYHHAAAIIAAISALDPAAVSRLNPPLDGDLLWRELEQTWGLFLGSEIERCGTRSGFAEDLHAALAELCRCLANGPRVPCHRDFMARNLMVLSDRRLGVLDHQDLRLGPEHYDLASLLNDSVRLRPGQASALAEHQGVSESLGYRRAAAQRCLKIIGTFHAFAERGSRRYLVMVPAALERAFEHLARIPETAPLLPELRKVFPQSTPMS